MQKIIVADKEKVFVIIEIRKVNFVNKGSELMLLSVLDKMREEFPSADFVMAPSPSSYKQRAILGLFQKAWIWKCGVQIGDIACLLPAKLRNAYGIVLDREINVVLDSAGFVYTDQWGDENILQLAWASSRWKKNGTKLIMLPQAFGPFKSEKTRRAMRTVIQNADIIFARESISYDNLINIADEGQNIFIAPDFTNLINGEVPENFSSEDKKFCIMPNYRMVDKTTKEKSEAYLPFLLKCAEELIKKKAKPFILIHSAEKCDILLSESISRQASRKLPIIFEENPAKIKGIIGECNGVIGNRFHGLVSAMSQGVPSIGLGWSHKYRKLFEDYGYTEGLLDVFEDQDKIGNKLEEIIDEDNARKIRAKLLMKSSELKKQSENMWNKVKDELNIKAV